MTIERARGAQEDATDLSAKYRGLYGFAHISVYLNPYKKIPKLLL